MISGYHVMTIRKMKRMEKTPTTGLRKAWRLWAVFAVSHPELAASSLITASGVLAVAVAVAAVVVATWAGRARERLGGDARGRRGGKRGTEEEEVVKLEEAAKRDAIKAAVILIFPIERYNW